MSNELDLQKIAHSFGRAAQQYHTQAVLQQDCAAPLLTLIEQWEPELPSGPILEVGCGTGFLTQGLCDRFPHRPLTVTDLSADMLHFCQQHLQIPPQRAPVSFQQLDGEHIDSQADPYGLIVASFVIQWFQQPVVTLRHWLKQLQPGGILCVSFPTCQSFPEWRQVCETLQIPYTANVLPNAQHILQELSSQVRRSHLIESSIGTAYHDATDFLRSLKVIGAGVNLSGQTLSPIQLKKLINYWNHHAIQTSPNGLISVHYHIAFLLLQR